MSGSGLEVLAVTGVSVPGVLGTVQAGWAARSLRRAELAVAGDGSAEAALQH